MNAHQRRVARRAAERRYSEESYAEIQKWMNDGHTYHCACRLTWGDGECECRLIERLAADQAALVAAMERP